MQSANPKRLRRLIEGGGNLLFYDLSERGNLKGSAACRYCRDTQTAGADGD